MVKVLVIFNQLSEKAQKNLHCCHVGDFLFCLLLLFFTELCKRYVKSLFCELYRIFLFLDGISLR